MTQPPAAPSPEKDYTDPAVRQEMRAWWNRPDVYAEHHEIHGLLDALEKTLARYSATETATNTDRAVIESIYDAIKAPGAPAWADASPEMQRLASRAAEAALAAAPLPTGLYLGEDGDGLPTIWRPTDGDGAPSAVLTERDLPAEHRDLWPTISRAIATAP